MKKQLLIFLTCALFLSIPALAHPGKTDNNGGHTNKNSGEYHYHHGYPAHNHIDGSCPYDFDNKTGDDSGYNSTKKSNSAKNSIVGNNFSPSTDSENIKNVEEERPMFFDIFPYVCAIVIIILSILNFTVDTDISPSRSEQRLNLVNGIISIIVAVVIISYFDSQRFLGICIVIYLLSRFLRRSRSEAELYNRINKLENDLNSVKEKSQQELEQMQKELKQAQIDAKFYRNLLPK